jgi:sugar lactone lactonase YvrE
VSVFAGTGVRGTADGAAATAQFSLPNSVAVSANGQFLYVNDVAPTSGTFHPNLLRVIDLQGSVSIRGSSFGKIKAGYR